MSETELSGGRWMNIMCGMGFWLLLRFGKKLSCTFGCTYGWWLRHGLWHRCKHGFTYRSVVRGPVGAILPVFLSMIPLQWWHGMLRELRPGNTLDTVQTGLSGRGGTGVPRRNYPIMMMLTRCTLKTWEDVEKLGNLNRAQLGGRRVNGRRKQGSG